MSSNPTKGEKDSQQIKAEGLDLESEPVTATPPSSPPLGVKMPQNNSMGPPPVPASKKRSVDEMHGDSHSAADSRASGADFAPLAQEGEEDTIDSQSIKQSDSQAEAKAAKALREAPVQATTPTPSQKLPPSGQGSQKPLSKSTSGTKPSTQAKTEEDDAETDASGSDEEDDDEPQNRIEDFDWTDLQQRYHNKMGEFDQKELAIMSEFSALADYFNVWAQAGSHKDVERSFKRLKTQMTYVQNEEAELEKRRQHYVKVVEAFKTVATMLNDPNLVQGHAIVVEQKKPAAKAEHPPPAKRQKKSEPRICLDDYGPHALADDKAGDHGCWNFPASRCAIQ
ncbi:hypothetical protein PRZ48_009764 [Zasmidium cellare]|uniref:Uncharacterized protein n=1 Tax=Zasmidium cellare TaxID=395010 RepID=A0ABR0EDC0_ZASCE|nr:hypothetical protein PRZ48_009764 [Zasmidium cellare]